MHIKTTPEVVEKMAKLAILASIPVGLGKLSYNPSLKEEDIKMELITNPNGVSIDYYDGRMVKFYARRIDDNTWEFDDQINGEYQSWIRTYDSYPTLYDTALRSLQ